MPINLTTPFAIPNGTRLVFARFEFDDDQETLEVPIELRTPGATDARVAGFRMIIRNGACTHVARQAAPPPGLALGDVSRYFVFSERTVPSGYADAVNAWRSAGTPGQRRAALEAHLLAAGHIHSSLGGA